MRRSIILLPFIYLYKCLKFILKIPMTLLKWFFIGFFTVIWVGIEIVVETIYNLIKYSMYGFIYISILVYHNLNSFTKKLLYGFIIICFFIYKWIKYITYGFYFPILLIARVLNKANIKHQAKVKIRQEKAIVRKLAHQKVQEKKVFERAQKSAERKKIRQEKLERSKKEKEERSSWKKKQREVFINQNVVIEKHDFNYKFKKFMESVNKIPQNIKVSFNKWYKNLSLVKNRRNRYDMEHQQLLISFEGDDAVRSAEKIPYEYVVKDQEGKISKGHYLAYSKVEVHSFLLSEGYEVYSIKTSPWVQMLYGRSNQTRAKFKTKDLIFFLTQLSTYIKSGIPLVDSLKILLRQYKSKKYRQIIRNIIYELTMGENFSDALGKQGVAFPRLLINMVKTSEMTGELPEALDDMANYYTEADKTRKQMITAMMYPTVIFVISSAVITFIMIYVVPKFTEIYAGMESSKVPEFTTMVINVSAFLKGNILIILASIAAVIIVFKYLHDNVKSVKTIMQWIAMHLPVFGNVIIYNEVTMFTKTFASLLKHNVFITNSMEILNKITNNEIYKMIILDTISNLAHGERLSLAFKNHWAFPIPAYEMLVTGEKTGQLPEMMAKVSDYYQELHKNAVTRIKTFLEPILIIFLTVVVGGIVLAIIIPMFSLYTSIQAT